jgi:hypothetical protein
MLSVRGSDGSLSRGILLLPLSGDNDDILLIDEEVEGATQHGQQDGGA